MSAPGNPWTNNETLDDAPFSERGFGLPPSPKPPAPGSTVSMKDGPDGGQIGSSSADKDGDQPPLKPTADATEGNKDSDAEGQIKPFFLEMGGDTPTTGSQRNKGKGRDNAGKGDDESQEQPTTVVTDERMPKIAAIPSKDSPSVMPARPPPFDGGRLASSIPGSVASRVKALDDTMPLRPARPSMDFTKDSAPGPSAARLSIGSEKMPSSIPKDSPPSSTNSTVPPAPSSVTSVGISDKAPSPEPTLSRNPSPLPSPRGSVQSDNDGGAPGQSHKSGQGDGSSYIEDPALYYGDPSTEQAVPKEPSTWRTYMPPDSDIELPSTAPKSGQYGSDYNEDPAPYCRDPSPEKAVPREPSNMSPGRMWMPPGSHIEMPCIPPKLRQYMSRYKEYPAPYCRDPSPEQAVPRGPSQFRMQMPPGSRTKLPCIPPGFSKYGSYYREDAALDYRDPSPEQAVPRGPSKLRMHMPPGSRIKLPMWTPSPEHWEAYKGKGGYGVEDKLPSAPRETDSLRPEPTFDGLYDASPQASRSHSPHTTDRSGPGSQESGPNIQPSSDTPPQNGERKCTSLNNQCEECASVRKTISSCVPEIYLRCPPDMHPVMLKFTIWGSVVDASQIAMSLTRYLYTSGPPGVRVNAAVRRAASATHREGRWYDLTSSEIPWPVTQRPSNPLEGVKVRTFLGQAFVWPSFSSSAKVVGKQHERRPRDFRVLIDFPVPVDEAVERYIISGLPRTSTKPDVRVVKSHQCLDRLLWWARIHPAESSSSSSSIASSEQSCSRRYRHGSSRRHHSSYRH